MIQTLVNQLTPLSGETFYIIAFTLLLVAGALSSLRREPRPVPVKARKTKRPS